DARGGRREGAREAARRANVLGTISIARRFMGPKGTANGGYACGVIASFARGSVAVRLLKPVPLDTPLNVEQRDNGLEVLHGGTPVAAARPGEIGDLVPPRPPTLDEAARASSRYAGFARHPAPECFVCGPLRAPGDALRIFAGPPGEAGGAAAPWTPGPSLESNAGTASAPFVRATLHAHRFVPAAPEPALKRSSLPAEPRLQSSSTQIAPSGPCSTSRIRCPMAKRSASRARSPSKTTRTSDCDESPPMNALPRQSGNSSPS